MDPDLPKGAAAIAGNGRGAETREVTARPTGKPVRKDEIVLEERGLYVESWLPERRSRRRPLYYVHGELAGSWLWERFLRYFAQRGWEGHALNLRAHFWSATADIEELSFDTYLEDATSMAAHGRLWYVKDAAVATQQVADEEASAAYLLDGMPPSAISLVAEAGEVMPQKSTYFNPKAPTGLVLGPLEW